jgi:formate transporter
VTTGAGNGLGHASWWAVSVSLGLILCVLLGAELFTSTTLTLVAKAANRITWAQLLKNWGLVYFGNLIGGLIIVGLIIMSAEYMAADGQWGLNAMKVAQHKIHLPSSRPLPSVSSATSWCVSPCGWRSAPAVRPTR